ncbi:MAG TPA: polysaccharide deacetylase family protein [Polyangiaceae bacterium]|nr:polysaccharide deacetylase family protein [Polyangiaceae bacterium]
MNRTTLATALDRMRVPQLLMSLRGSSSPWLTVLTYHRVGEPGVAGDLDDGVVDVTPDQLDRQLRYLRRWLDLVSLQDVLAWSRGWRGLPANPVLVTFDDGYRDNHDVALPILRRHGVRATFFVAVDYVRERRLYWWDRVALVLKRSSRECVRLEYPEPLVLPLRDARSRKNAVRIAQRIVKDRRGLDLHRFLDELEHAAGVSLDREEERRLAERTVMNWHHVLALRDAGMDVQSHTRSHRVLQTLDDEDLTRELRGSREELECVLGRTVSAVSYPVGKPLGDDQRIKRAVRECGYELGFSNGTGSNRLEAFDPFDARRMSLDVSLADEMFRTMLALPWLAY